MMDKYANCEICAKRIIASPMSDVCLPCGKKILRENCKVTLELLQEKMKPDSVMRINYEAIELTIDKKTHLAHIDSIDKILDHILGVE